MQRLYVKSFSALTQLCSAATAAAASAARPSLSSSSISIFFLSCLPSSSIPTAGNREGAPAAREVARANGSERARSTSGFFAHANNRLRRDRSPAAACAEKRGARSSSQQSSESLRTNERG